MREAFGFDLERYLYFGGYPGAAPLAGEPPRWRRYITDSLIETSLSRDVLLLTRVDKPKENWPLALEILDEALS